MRENGWRLLDQALTAEAIDEATRYIARDKYDEQRGTRPVVIFRLGVERLALSTTAFDEITEMRPIHTLPHRLNDVVLGLTNVRGELLVCISLARMLGIEAGDDTGKRGDGMRRRLVVLRNEGKRIVFPVDDVHGTHWFREEDMKEVPATIAKAAARYTKAMLLWHEKAVGLLDDQLLFYAVNRSLA